MHWSGQCVTNSSRTIAHLYLPMFSQPEKTDLPELKGRWTRNQKYVEACGVISAAAVLMQVPSQPEEGDKSSAVQLYLNKNRKLPASLLRCSIKTTDSCCDTFYWRFMMRLWLWTPDDLYQSSMTDWLAWDPDYEKPCLRLAESKSADFNWWMSLSLSLTLSFFSFSSLPLPLCLSCHPATRLCQV